MLNFAHERINNYTMKVARVKSLPDCHQEVSVIPNPKEAFDEIDVVDDVSLPCKRCYPDVPIIMPFLRIRSLCPYGIKALVSKLSQVNSPYVWLMNL